MKKKYPETGFNLHSHVQILKELLIGANSLVLVMYALLHLIFNDLPFAMQDELPVILNIIGLASLTALSIGFLIFAVDGTRFMIKHRGHYNLDTEIQLSKA